MLGLFGTLEMARSSLQVAQNGVQLAGHNLANAANPAYARQRLHIESAETIPTPVGEEGTGAQVVGYDQIRDKILDNSIVFEGSITGFLEEKERSLVQMESYLGQSVDRQSATSGVSGAAGGQYALAEGLSEFFNTFQSLSVAPTSTSDRQMLILKGQQLASKFNDLDSRLNTLRNRLNEDVPAEIDDLNKLLVQISETSSDIKKSESGAVRANELRDRRQEKLEALSKFIDIQVTDGTSFNLSVNGTVIISDSVLIDTFNAVADGNGMYQPQSTVTGQVIALNAGKLKGTLDSRDISLVTLRNSINTLATNLVAQVNTLHQSGIALDGTTGRRFFTGTNASNITVNTALSGDPRLIQVSGNGDPGDNAVALSLARLSGQPIDALGGRTFADSYNVTVTNFGQELSDVQVKIADQTALTRMLASQRESISGVSVDDEMTRLITFQRAYQSSSKLISILDELLAETIHMGAR